MASSARLGLEPPCPSLCVRSHVLALRLYGVAPRLTHCTASRLAGIPPFCWVYRQEREKLEPSPVPRSRTALIPSKPTTQPRHVASWLGTGATRPMAPSEPRRARVKVKRSISPSGCVPSVRGREPSSSTIRPSGCEPRVVTPGWFNQGRLGCTSRPRETIGRYRSSRPRAAPCQAAARRQPQRSDIRRSDRPVVQRTVRRAAPSSQPRREWSPVRQRLSERTPGGHHGPARVVPARSRHAQTGGGTPARPRAGISTEPWVTTRGRAGLRRASPVRQEPARCLVSRRCQGRTTNTWSRIGVPLRRTIARYTTSRSAGCAAISYGRLIQL